MLALARANFLDGRRLDLTVLSRELGVGRATIYRWFGSRDGLLGAVLAEEFATVMTGHRARVRRRGAPGLLEVFDAVNRTLARSRPLRSLLEQERDAALRLLTSSGGPVQPRAVELVKELIEAELESGAYQPPADPGTLAYAVVRLAEAFLYNDAAIGIRGDHERLLEVQAALLGVAATPARDRPPQRPGRRLPAARRTSPHA